MARRITKRPPKDHIKGKEGKVIRFAFGTKTDWRKLRSKIEVMGVYLIFKDGEYIDGGSSNNVYRRLGQHLRHLKGTYEVEVLPAKDEQSKRYLECWLFHRYELPAKLKRIEKGEYNIGIQHPKKPKGGCPYCKEN